MDKPIKVILLDTVNLDNQIRMEIERHGIEIVDPTDDQEIAEACDIIGMRVEVMDLSKMPDPFSIPEPEDCRCGDDGSPVRPDWKQHRHKGGHKRNARKSKRK